MEASIAACVSPGIGRRFYDQGAESISDDEDNVPSHGELESTRNFRVKAFGGRSASDEIPLLYGTDNATEVENGNDKPHNLGGGKVKNGLPPSEKMEESLNKCREEMSDLGKETILPEKPSPPAAGAEINDVKGTESLKTSSKAASSSLFDKNPVKVLWGLGYEVLSALRIAQSALPAIHIADPEALLIVNLVKGALGLILQSYDTASAQHNVNKLRNTRAESLPQAQGSGDKTSLMTAPAKSEEEDKTEKTNDSSPSQNLKDPPGADVLIVPINVVKVSDKAGILAADAREQRMIADLVRVKEALFNISAVISLFRALQAYVPVLAVGANAAAAMSGATLGIGLVSNVYDIYQGCIAAKDANKEYENLLNKKNKIKEAADASNLRDEIKNGISEFFTNKINNARISHGMAIGRIVRGIIGVAIAAVGIAALVLSAGSIPLILGIIGGVVSLIYFAGVMFRLSRSISQSNADEMERKECEELKKQFSISIFDNSDGNKNLSEQPGKLSEAYKNKYFLTWSIAKQFQKDVIEKGETKNEKLENLLESMGLTEGDIELIRNRAKDDKKDGDENIEEIEKLINSKLGI